MNEAIGSVSTIKMEDPTISNFMVGKEGMINIFQSTCCHNQDNSSLYRHCYENLKYHSKVNKNATSISSSAHKIASCPNFFRILKIKIIANKQQQKHITMLCFVMFSSEQLYISVHIRKSQGTKINLYCIKSYFTLSGGSRCCYRQMLKIIVCCYTVPLSNKHHITHAVGWLPNYTNTTIYNTGSNKHT